MSGTCVKTTRHDGWMYDIYQSIDISISQFNDSTYTITKNLQDENPNIAS